MHILYIHQHFATPEGSTGTRSYEFARRWVKAGHKVTLITGYYDIGGLQVKKGLYRKKTIEGINVVVVGTKYSNKQSYIRRIISFLSFCLLSIYASMRVKDADVIYASSTPLTVGISAMVIKWARRVPFVFEVRDQWPEIPIELGIIKNRLLIKILLWLEKTIYKSSSRIVALSPGQAEGIKEVLTDERPIAVIPNSCDIDVFRPDIDGSAVRQKRGWGDKLVLLHTGAMGKVNGLKFVIDAAERLKNQGDISFALTGDGNQKSFLESEVKKLGLANVEIFSSVAKRELAEYYAAADAGLVIIGNYPIIEHNSANKFFDSLSAGKPVLINYSGWQRKILEENEAGFGCDLCNLEQFVEKVLYLNSHRQQLKQMGQNARRVAVEKFDRDMLAKQALETISALKMNKTQNQVEFKELQVEYAQQVAALHIQYISTGFISSMGIDFVTRLYEAIAQSKSSFGVVAVRNGKVLGFAAFTANINALYKSIVFRKGIKFALLLAGHIFSLKRVKGIFETLLYPARIKRMNLPSAELLSIAVAGEEQRKGLAGELIERGFRDYRKKGVEKVKVLIGAENRAGNKMYLKYGFEFAGQINNHGVLSNIYIGRTNHV